MSTESKKPPFDRRVCCMLLQQSPGFDWLNYFSFDGVPQSELRALADEARELAEHWASTESILLSKLRQH